MQGEEMDLGAYRVVVNHEDQYSILPVAYAIPQGWRDAGFEGSKDDCLARIREWWTDMRPLSVRDAARG
ncbi:MbtH family NRPS accessory protein [Lysobacter sp. Root604]|uniref:MbtH family protein n=2 Tax=Lysobacter TaxID=68 RepID=UPI0006F7E776|nr:MbtH family NRPS accessory protein [Lysobacter sp. Root604]KRA16862.1 antibiotic synthesis protein MbtH [Lysobacter sp. Root604]KRD28662.1 antibiotic synthesis protein MbtH [Lysobacter sp. Root916]KRD73974.1 antibiotic synthesis protein MbtH [Lysobacter sp. Root983]